MLNKAIAVFIVEICILITGTEKSLACIVLTKFLVLFEIKKDVVVEMTVPDLGGHHK